jgi:hypothetical protein
MDLGDHEQARALLSSLEPTTPHERLERDIDLAANLLRSGELAEGVLQARSVQERLGGMDGVDGQLRYGLAWMLYSAGDIRRGREVLLPLVSESVPRGVIPLRLLLLQGALALDAGDLQEAEFVIERALTLAESSFDVAYVRVQQAILTALRGNIEQALHELNVLTEAMQHLDRPDLRPWLATLRTRTFIELGLPPELDCVEPTSMLEDMLASVVYRHHVLWRNSPTVPAFSQPAHPDIRTTALLSEANAELANQRPKRAAEAARVAMHLAEAHGYGVLLAEASSLLRESLFLMGHLDDWRELHRARCDYSSVIFDDLARLECAVSERESLDAGLITSVASAGAPRARRRALAILGEAPILDARDEAFVEVVLNRLGVRFERAPCAQDEVARAGPRIVLDERRQSVWIDERRVALDSKPLLWTITRLLAERTQPILKEDLVREAWDVDGYHPLRHDARVHTAISALRKTLHGGDGAPFIVRSPDGYAFAPTARVRYIADV